MRTNSSISILTLLIILIIGCQEKKEPSNQNAWIRIFNGNDLNDWQVKIKGYELGENHKSTFRVIDGVLQVNYDQYDAFDSKFGHIFYKKPFSNYKLRLQYRFIGEQVTGGAGWAEKNSGVMIHSQSPESMTVNQEFPVSIEVQLLGGVEKEKERPTGNLCTPGTHVVINDQLTTDHCISSSSPTFYDDQWINLELLVLNDSLISHMINGESVITYSHPVIGGDYNALPDMEGKKLTEGYISLQSESHPIEFRNIELLELENSIRN